MKRFHNRAAMFHVEQISMAKLSRKQVREGLQQVPIDTLLLGVDSPIGKLTPKQREFARLVAMGETKAGAYREAYNSKGKPHTVGNRGYELAGRGEIQGVIDAYQAAIEAAKYRTPAQLRELVIHQLTQHALDDSFPPAQRVKALELLGKVSEVAAFTERKETTIIKQSSDIRAKLLEHLQNVVDVDARETGSDDTDNLLQEIANSRQTVASETVEGYYTPTPLSDTEGSEYSLHTTPHKQSSENAATPHKEPDPNVATPDDSDPKSSLTFSQGGDSIQEDPPLSSEKEQGEGVYFSEIGENDVDPKDK